MPANEGRNRVFAGVDAELPRMARDARAFACAFACALRWHWSALACFRSASWSYEMRRGALGWRREGVRKVRAV